MKITIYYLPIDQWPGTEDIKEEIIINHPNSIAMPLEQFVRAFNRDEISPNGFIAVKSIPAMASDNDYTQRMTEIKPKSNLDPNRCEICSYIQTPGNTVTCELDGNTIPDVRNRPDWCKLGDLPF